MTDLKELLEGQIAQQPHDAGDAQAAIRAGRRKLQTRRAAAVGGAALTSALAGALVLSLTRIDPAGTPEDGPAVGPELSFADAQPAVEGVDYDLLDHNVMTETDQDVTSITYDGFTTDGLGYAHQEYQGRPVLVDPRTREKDLLPKPPTGTLFMAPPTYLGTDRLVFVTGGDGQERFLDPGEKSPAAGMATGLTFDRASRIWSKTTWTGLPEDGYPDNAVLGGDDRIYLAIGVFRTSGSIGRPTAFDVWSVSVEDPSDVRDENLTVGSLTGVGSSLVWTDPPGTASPKIHLRDLANGAGAETTIDGRAGCLPTVGSSGNDELVLAQFACEDDAKDQVAVYTKAGDHLASVVGKDAVAGGLNDTHLLAYVPGGTYTLDLESKELLKVSNDSDHESQILDGSLVFWNAETPDAAVDQTVAEMK